MKRLKKYNFTFLLMTTLLVSVSCKKNGENLDSDLKINFQTKVNGANFGIGDSYVNADGAVIKYEMFQFYLSDIELINSDGATRLISEIELFKFDANGLASIDFKAPQGQYNSISFGIGVKKTLNEADPSDYAIEGHPLNITESTYWGWAGMYRFVMSEGRFDADSDGDFEGTFAYHTGRELSYRTLTLATDLKIKKKDDNAITLNVDLFQFLDKSGNRVDPQETPFYHGSTENEELTIRLSDNIKGAISIAE